MAPPSLPRVRTDTVPLVRRYGKVLRLPAPLAPRFVAFAWRYHALRLSFRSRRSRAPTAGQGFVFRSPLPDVLRMEAIQDLPGSWGTLVSLCPVLRPRQDHAHQAHTMRGHGPRYVHNEGSHDNESFGAQSHGLGTRCLRFVRCVAVPDAKLASGRWPSSPGRDWLPAGLRRKVSKLLLTSHPPFPSFPGARTFIIFKMMNVPFSPRTGRTKQRRRKKVAPPPPSC